MSRRWAYRSRIGEYHTLHTTVRSQVSGCWRIAVYTCASHDLTLRIQG
jgi:hypothetical protein